MSIEMQILHGLRSHQEMYETAPVDAGGLAASSIISELRSRSGIGNAFDMVEEDTLQEIHCALSEIVNVCIWLHEDDVLSSSDDLEARIKAAIEDYDW